MRRAAFVFASMLLLSAIGTSTLLSWAMGGLMPTWPPAAPFATAAAVIAAAAFAFVGAMRRVGEPAGDIIAAAHRVANGDLDVHIAPQGPPWLRAVAAAFNDMAARLARQERQRRELMADVAHELRTPLAIVQGRLEGIVDGVYPYDAPHIEPLLDETRMLGRLVDDLRSLANAESGALTLEREPTDIGMLIRDAAAAVEDDARTRGISLEPLDSPDLPAIDVDPVRIRQVLLNVLANAVQHSERGGSVAVRSALVDGRIEIHVSNSGAGIPPEDLGRVFDRFHKGRRSHGSGLGLTIARTLARAHGGDIAARNHDGGVTLTITLPAA